MQTKLTVNSATTEKNPLSGIGTKPLDTKAAGASVVAPSAGNVTTLPSVGAPPASTSAPSTCEVPTPSSVSGVTGSGRKEGRTLSQIASTVPAQAIFAGLSVVVIATFIIGEGTAQSSRDATVVISAGATILSLTCAVWVWWKELSTAALLFMRALVTPWLCFFVGLAALSASHLWLSATNPSAFAAMNPLASVPVLIALTSVFRELLLRTARGVEPTDWEKTLEASDVPGNAPAKLYKTGDTVTADSKISKGSVVVRERWLSPVAELRIRDEQDVLFAGSKVVVGEVEVNPLSTTSSSVLSQLIKSIRKAGPQTSVPLDQSQWSNVACFACLCIAASVGIFWNERGVSAVTSATLACTVLSVSVFMLVWQSVAEMSLKASQAIWRTGVFVRTRTALERLRRVRHMAVVRDASPLGLPRLIGFDVLDDRYDREALAGVLLALSGRAEDPWHQAICRFINDSGLPIALLRAADYREYDGRGISAVIQGVEFTLGTESFVLERGVQLQSGDTCPPEAVVDHVLYLAIQRYVVLRLSLKWDEKTDLDALRRFAGDKVTLVGVTPLAPLVTEKISDGITFMSGSRDTLQASLLSDSVDLVFEGGRYPELSSPRALTVERFAGQSFELPAADVVLFTSELSALGQARITADRLWQWETRQRGIVVGLIVSAVCAAVVGFGSPAIAIILACAACVFSLQTQKKLRLS